MAEYNLVQPKHHDVYPFISPSEGLSGAASGRSVLVVGSGTGIGKAIASAFAESGAANLVITSRRQANLDQVKKAIEEKYPKTKVLALAADGKDQDQVERLFSQIKDAGVSLDILVNSQGARTGRGKLLDVDPKDWWEDIESYLKSPYLTTRAFLRSLSKPATPPATPDKFVINITSIAANALLPLGSSYCIPKVGLDRLTEFTAAEAAHLGVSSVALHPGGVPDTDMTSKSPPWMRQYFTETAELAAGAVVYCTTPRAAYLSGRYVDVRWDLEELEQHKDKVEKENILKHGIFGDTRMIPSAEQWKSIYGE